MLRRALATNGAASHPASGEVAVMDVRPSPEQQALHDSAAQVVDRLGPQAVGELDDPKERRGSTPRSTASGWRELRVEGPGMAPLASGVEPIIIGEELGREAWATSRSSVRRWPSSCGGSAGAPPVPSVETVATRHRSWVAGHAGRCRVRTRPSPLTCWVAIRALLVVPIPTVTALARIDLGPSRSAAPDLTRPR